MKDGYLKIKTKLDNKDIDKGVAELENKIKKLQEDNKKSSTEQSSLQKEIDNYEKLKQEADAYKNKIKELKTEKEAMFKANSNLAVTTDTPEYAGIKAQIIDMQQKYAQATAEIDKQAPKIEKVYTKLNKVKAKQTENNTKIGQFKQKIEQINLKKVQSGIDNVGKSIQTSINKLGRMTMAVFGIRTAFNMVRQAMSAVAQYNPQISADFEYMRYCIANLLTPVIQGLVKLLYTVLSYVNAIASAWFGINLFGNSSVKNFQKMQKSASGTAKSAKEIQKSLAHFDEINVLQDNTDKSSDKGTGVVTPSIDLSGMQADVPAWLQWIIDNKSLVLSILAGIAAGIMALKVGLGGLKALGIGIMIAGIISLVQSIIKYLQDPSWENFGRIISSIGIIILGLGLIIGNIPLIIAGAIIAIIGLIVSNWEKIKGFLQSGIDWLLSKTDWVREHFGIIGEAIYKVIVVFLQNALNIFDSIFTAIKGVFDGLIMFIKGVFTGDWKMAWEGIKKIFSSIWEGIKGIFTSVWNALVQVVEIAINLIKGIIETVLGVIKTVWETIWNGISTFASNIWNAIVKVITNIINTIKNTIQNVLNTIKIIWNNVWNGLKTTVVNIFNGIWNAIKGVINSILGGIEGMANGVIKGINFVINALNRLHFDIPDWVPELGGKKFGFNITPLNAVSLPRLAKGGIINQPTQAIIGEAGKEAVLPLENNTEWMDALADKVAKIMSTSPLNNNGGDIVLKFDSSIAQFVRMLKPELDKESQRKGRKLVIGGI